MLYLKGFSQCLLDNFALKLWTHNCKTFTNVEYTNKKRCEILESKIDTKKYQSVDHLKKALRRQWDKIPQSHFRSACDGFIDHLKAIIRAKGGQFEQI